MQNIEKLNRSLTEFYDKMSSWEQSVVKDTPYSLAQIHTIEVLGHHQALRMKDLAEKLAITTGTLTVQIERLVAAELVERVADPQDRRAIVVVLTEHGRAIYQQHNQLHLDLVKELSKHIDAQQMRVLLDSLDKLNNEF